MSLLGERSAGPTHCIYKKEALGKDREMLIADSAPGSGFNSCAGNENVICVRKSKKKKIEGEKKKAKTERKNT